MRVEKTCFPGPFPGRKKKGLFLVSNPSQERGRGGHFLLFFAVFCIPRGQFQIFFRGQFAFFSEKGVSNRLFFCLQGEIDLTQGAVWRSNPLFTGDF